MRGGRGVECVLRGDITPAEGGPLAAAARVRRIELALMEQTGADLERLIMTDPLVAGLVEIGRRLERTERRG